MTEFTTEIAARSKAVDWRNSRSTHRLAVKIREIWNRACPPRPIRHEFDVALLRLFAQGLHSSCLVRVVFCCIVAALAASFVPLGAALAWLGAQAFLLVLTQCLTRQFFAESATTIDAKSWRGKFIAAETARGLLWAVLVGFVAETGDPSARAFGLTVLLSVAAMTATTAASIPASVFATLTPLTAMIIFGQAGLGFDSAALPIVALACCAQFYFMRVAKKLHATALDTLSIQAEKDGLISELATAKVTSDLARRRAEEANLAKSRFLAAMSHELRTPLNAILGFSEVMKGELFGAHIIASYKEYSSDIHTSGQHLLVLINEILDLSRIEAGRFELREEAVRLDHVVDDCRRLLALRAKNREISLEAAIEPDLPALWADERAVRQVALNLLSNAIKFTSHGGAIKIKIGWTASGGQYFSVRDSGPGIPEEEIPTIMTSFGRGTLAQKNAEEGSGLGLPIVKGLVELHGGTFILRSKLREGTEVIVIFPRGRVNATMSNLAKSDGNSKSGRSHRLAG